MPHELPAKGTPERIFMEHAYNEIQQDQEASGGAGQSGGL